MLLPIGVSNFRKLIEHRSDSDERYLFVDKSIFVREVMNDGSDVIVITRPRRFGKTINISMLQHFLSEEVDGKSTKHLFSGLEIEKHTDTIARHQGKYPVIFVSFKDVKQASYNSCIDKFRFVLSALYKSFETELYSDKISKLEKKYIDSIINGESNESSLEGALLNLTNYLHTYYNKKPILLIDVYGTSQFVKSFVEDNGAINKLQTYIRLLQLSVIYYTLALMEYALFLLNEYSASIASSINRSQKSRSDLFCH